MPGPIVDRHWESKEGQARPLQREHSQVGKRAALISSCVSLTCVSLTVIIPPNPQSEVVLLFLYMGEETEAPLIETPPPRALGCSGQAQPQLGPCATTNGTSKLCLRNDSEAKL